METLKDCLDSMDRFEVVGYGKIRILNSFERMRECIIVTYREQNFVNESSLLRILSQINHITEKKFSMMLTIFKKTFMI